MAVDPTMTPTATGQKVNAIGVIITNPTPVVMPAVAPFNRGCS